MLAGCLFGWLGVVQQRWAGMELAAQRRDQIAGQIRFRAVVQAVQISGGCDEVPLVVAANPFFTQTAPVFEEVPSEPQVVSLIEIVGQRIAAVRERLSPTVGKDFLDPPGSLIHSHSVQATLGRRID